MEIIQKTKEEKKAKQNLFGFLRELHLHPKGDGKGGNGNTKQAGRRERWVSDFRLPGKIFVYHFNRSDQNDRTI